MKTVRLLALSLFMASCSPDTAVDIAVPNMTDPTSERTEVMAAVDDPYIWLENVDGAEALAWAAAQNALSIPRLQGDPRFAEIESEIAAILTSDDRIPFANLVDGVVYNFWQDDEHVRGILRRTSLDSYASEDTQWETVLDVDSLANIENANWVYKGRVCLPSDPSRCLLQLSDGGKDAVVVREYDLANKNFVDGGFVLDNFTDEAFDAVIAAIFSNKKFDAHEIRSGAKDFYSSRICKDRVARNGEFRRFARPR